MKMKINFKNNIDRLSLFVNTLFFYLVFDA